MLKLRSFGRRRRNFPFLLAENCVTRVAVLAEDFAIRADMLSVMAAEAAGEVVVPAGVPGKAISQIKSYVRQRLAVVVIAVSHPYR